MSKFYRAEGLSFRHAYPLVYSHRFVLSRVAQGSWWPFKQHIETTVKNQNLAPFWKNFKFFLILISEFQSNEG